MSQDKVMQQFAAAIKLAEAKHEAARLPCETELKAAYQQFEAEVEKEGADYADIWCKFEAAVKQIVDKREAAYQQFEAEVKAVVMQFYYEFPGAHDAMDSFLSRRVKK